MFQLQSAGAVGRHLIVGARELEHFFLWTGNDHGAARDSNRRQVPAMPRSRRPELQPSHLESPAGPGQQQLLQ